MAYFFAVPGKLFAYSLGYFLQSHIESYSPHLLPYKPEAEGVVYHQLLRQQVGGITFDVGLQKYPKEYAKSILGSTQKISLGQQKSSPQ